MTNKEDLYDAGLTDADIKEMQKSGAATSKDFDVESAYDLARKYDGIGDDVNAAKMLSLGETAANFWSNKVEELTGKSIYFDDRDLRWHDDETGRYVKDPYTEVRADDYELSEWIINRYGEFE